MPPRKDVAPVKKDNKAYSKADPISNGEVLTDLFGKQWRIGKSIGSGGFGEIYLASNDITKAVNDKANYVVKIEPFSNGPLFVEIAFYIRIAKSDMIEDWKRQKKLDFLGMPYYVASGAHEYKSQQYRFMVIQRFGLDLHKVLQEKTGKRFSIRTAQSIAIQVIDTLEYIHSKSHIHGDIKASNLMLGLGTGPNAKKSKLPQQVYLLDFGLAGKFVNADESHVAYGPDARRAHNGTLEYTSRDAHVGAFSRRGDLEILGYNLLEWLCGSLPWSAKDPPEKVHKQKEAFMANLNLKSIYPADIPGLDLIEKFLKYVSSMSFEEVPNYNRCKEILKKGLPPNSKGSLYLDDVAYFPVSSKPTSKSSAKRTVGADAVDNVAKKLRVPDIEDEKDTIKRSTRTTRKVKDFNWARVLSSDPEKMVRAASSLSQQSTSGKEDSTNKTPSPVIGIPTPAMLQILSKKKENIRSPIKAKTVEIEGTTSYTPAMREIMMKKKTGYPKLAIGKRSFGLGLAVSSLSRRSCRIKKSKLLGKKRTR